MFNLFKKETKEKKGKKSIALSKPWLKSYPDTYPKDIDCPKMSMIDDIKETAKKYPDYFAYQYFGQKVTYKNFIEQIESCAKSLKNLGVTENDAVTICMPNTPEAIIMFYAVNMVGAVANMIHPLSAEKEIEYYLNIAESKYIFTINISLQKVMNVIDKTKVKNIIVVSPANSMNFVMKFLYWATKGRKLERIEDDKIVEWNDFIKNGKEYEGKYNYKKDADELAMILYSGGTTGSPKGIMLSCHNFNILARQVESVCGQAKAGDSIISLMPIFHCFGLGICVHLGLHMGLKCILVPEFKIKGFDKFIKKNKPAIMLGVPTLFEALLKNNNYKKDELKSITCAVCGGDALQESLKAEINSFLKKHGSSVTVRAGYGMTESSGPTCAMPTVGDRKDCIGLPLPGMLYKIVKIGTHEECEYNEDGEICVSGPTLMMGYLNNEEETYQTLREHEDGITWLHTGDIGCMDEDGYIYFKQRLKRMIISSGYNVYPSHIESVINEFPEVLTCTVIGIPHPHKVQVAKAYIVLKEGVAITDKLKQDIKEHCKKHLANYSVPAQFEYRDSLPKTLVGKVAYRELEKESQ